MKNLGTVEISTPRLLLRRFSLKDADDMYNNWARDEEVTRYLTWPPHAGVDVSRAILESWIQEYTKDTYYQWCIELKETGEAIGSIGVVNFKQDIYAAEIGYCIGRKFWNQGIMSEALEALIKFFFEEVGLNRIESRHDPLNPGSGKVMLKCQMKYEGRRIKADRNNTGICDVHMYGIINTF